MLLSIFRTLLGCLILGGVATPPSAIGADGAAVVAFERNTPGQLTVTIGKEKVATYVYQDENISRPYFAHVHAPGGIQVTRNHPPIAGQDVDDHATYHPGIWMAFGDISGSDYWRLKSRVAHVRFVGEPFSGAGKGGFAVRNRYLDRQDSSKTVCEEITRFEFHVRKQGYLLVWDATFTSSHDFYFGDQEEMGLGFRVATPIRVEEKSENAVSGGGTILDAKGRKNGREIWGNAADWCDYSGTLDGQHVGITLFCHPRNFRPSWFHARDYGLLLANPFGRKAFDKGDSSKVIVKRGERLRLRYGLLLHAHPKGTPIDLESAYTDYVRLTKD